MKAKLTKNGNIRIKTENASEAFALEHLMKKSVNLSELIIFDNSILDKNKKKNKTDTVTER